MNLARRKREFEEPWLPLNRLREEINRLFDFRLSDWPRPTELFERWGPAVDLYEDKDNITVTAELPGLKQEEIDVSLEGRTLSISGERKRDETQGKGESYRAERYYGRFHRSITLPQTVDAARISASYKDGILSVRLPKAEESKPKRIEVKAT